MTTRTCRYCKYAKWQRDKSGRRVISNGIGDCTYPVPLLPLAMVAYQHRGGNYPMQKFFINDSKLECETFEEGVYHEAEDS